MPSKRELILQNFKSVLNATAGISGRVYRSDPDPTTKELHPFIDLTWNSDSASPETVPMLERTLTVNVAVYGAGDVPDSAIDSVITDAHRLIMLDTQRGSLAIDTKLVDAQCEIEGGDTSRAKITHSYEVKYRHSYGDMTQ